MTTTAKELLERLQRHYIKPGDIMPGGVFMPEVTLDRRRADALYVGFFSSRGRHLVGHEIKVSRADWLHELDQPAKAETWEPNCHQWYVVAPDTQIVRTEELPHGWGLMIPGRSRTRMEIVVKAQLHTDRTPSWEATHALVQKADSLRIAAIEDARRTITEKARADVDERVERLVAARTGDESIARERDDLKATLSQLEEILGLKIRDHAWKDGQVTVKEIRSSFARWVAADKDVTRAADLRYGILDNARERIGEAITALAKVRADA